MSLTGDALTDRLVPVAARLVSAVRENNAGEVKDAFGEAYDVCDPEVVDGAEALAVVLAGMVPWNVAPSDLLAWLKHQQTFCVLVEMGVEPAVAADLISQKWDPT